jgi:hypothetical protein
MQGDLPVMNKLLAALSFAFLAACGTQPDTATLAGANDIKVVDVTAFANLMPPLPADFDGRVPADVTIDVLSGGCTDASSFKAQITQAATRQTLKIERVSPDLCEAVPHHVQVKLTVPGYKLHTKLYYAGKKLDVTENVVY